jgi:hypothetical protein
MMVLLCALVATALAPSYAPAFCSSAVLKVTVVAASAAAAAAVAEPEPEPAVASEPAADPEPAVASEPAAAEPEPVAGAEPEPVGAAEPDPAAEPEPAGLHAGRGFLLLAGGQSEDERHGDGGFCSWRRR